MGALPQVCLLVVVLVNNPSKFGLAALLFLFLPPSTTIQTCDSPQGMLLGYFPVQIN